MVLAHQLFNKHNRERQPLEISWHVRESILEHVHTIMSAVEKIKTKINQQTLYLRGQEILLQAFDSIAAPRPMEEQSLPPLDGAGLVQERYLCISPPPHVTSQSDQSLHGVYPPFSANNSNRTLEVR